MVEDILNSLYEVEVEGRKYRLKPEKAWVIKPPGKPGIVVALFRLPNGRTVRRAIARLPP